MLWSGGRAHAQSVFELDLKTDVILSTLSLGVFFGSFLIPETSGFPDRDINNVNFIDRNMVAFNTSFDIVPLIFKPVLGALPVIVPIALTQLDLRADFFTWMTYGFMYGQAVGFTYGTRRAIGRLAARYRPRHYVEEDRQTPFPANSFPSGSTAMAFVPATFLSVTFAAEFPDSPWRIPVIVGTHTVAAGVGAARILAGHHWLTDVIAGAAIGSFYGWLIPTLHRRPDTGGFSFRFTGDSAVMSLRF